MTSKIPGAFLVLLSVLGLWGYSLTHKPLPPKTPATASTLPRSLPPSNAPITVIHGYIGGEKVSLLQNSKIQKILADKYRIQLQAYRRGSAEMVTTEPLEGVDFLWPGSQSQTEQYRRTSKPRLAEEVLFVSPLVIYSWDLVENALTQAGIIKKEGDNTQGETYYTIDMPRLLETVQQHTKWKDLGVIALFGSVKVTFPNPTKSNCGSQYLALSATVLSGAEPLSLADLDRVEPQLKQMTDSLGLMQNSSTELFNQYIKQGVGAFPMMAGYENQILEFAIANPDHAPLIRDKLRLLYPVPTVWANHPMIALSEPGRRLIDAMKDPDIQMIAWKEYGLRTERTPIDKHVNGVPGIADTLTSVVPTPSLEVFDRMLAGLETSKP